METGTVSTSSLPGGLDLGLTIESGQTYCWRRADGRTYEGDPGGDAWYHTVVGIEAGSPPAVARRDPDDHAVVRVRQREGRLEWQSTVAAEGIVRELLRLDDDLDAIAAAAPDDPVVDAAFEYADGMRLVRDPPFPTLISFICSAQMRVSRIHDMVTALAREYGPTATLSGETYHGLPTPDRLARATEDELRDLGLGYRAPYVQRTAEMVADARADGGETAGGAAAADASAADGDPTVAHPADARELPYEAAREGLARFVGVGDKVADCVCLFSLGHLEAVPLDTWIRTAIEDHFPDCDRDNYADTSRAIRRRLSGDRDPVRGDRGAVLDGAPAGYVQTYVFHFLRTRDGA